MAFQFSPKIVTDGLVLYLDAGNTKSYPGTGATWSDLSRNRNNGTLSGPTFNSGNSGYILFDGLDDFVSVPDGNSWDFTTAMSVELWVYVTSYDAAGSVLIHQQNGATVGGFEIWIDTSGGIHFNQSAISNYLTTSTGVFSRNIWQHVVCTHNGTTARVYLNGVSYPDTLANPNKSLPSTSTNGQLRIGSWASVGSYEMAGRISIVRIYNGKALSQAEILQNYNATKSRFGL
jgi:hypothetical protein